MANIDVIKIHLNNVIQYLQPLLPLANSHMVSFFTENHWKNAISTEIQSEFSKIHLPGLHKIFRHINKTNQEVNTDISVLELMKDSPHISQHLSTARKECLGYQSDILSHCQFQDKLRSWGSEAKEEYSVSEFMSFKKTHEVEMMRRVVAALTNISKSSHIVDVGSGKGYLSSMLALQHGLRVLGVDSSQINTHGASKRSEKLQKYWPGLYNKAMKESSKETKEKHGKHWKSKFQKEHNTSATNENNEPKASSSMDITHHSVSLYKQSTMFITETTDLEDIMRNNFPGESTYTMALVGLHTCGNLASTCLKLFAKNCSVRALCNVGCCYHLIEEEFSSNPFLSKQQTEKTEFGFPMSNFLRSQKFSLGRNARMLAAQPVERLSVKDEIPIDSLFFRALLQVILKEHTGEERPDWQVGRIASKCKTFTEYFEKSVEKLNINLKLPSSHIVALYDQYMEQRDKLEAFFLLRVALAPVVEILIMLDRILYLLEEDTKEVHIVQLFDPVISPRCYGILALKDFNSS